MFIILYLECNFPEDKIHLGSPNFIKTFFNGIYKKSQSRFFRQKNVGGVSKKQKKMIFESWSIYFLLFGRLLASTIIISDSVVYHQVQAINAFILKFLIIVQLINYKLTTVKV